MELEDEEKLHYYLISFSYSNDSRKVSGYASARIGWIDNFVNNRRIDEARRYIALEDDYVPLSVSYLGHMTKHQMKS